MRTFVEIGTSGLRQWNGFIEEAYNTKLTWPSVQPLYNRIRRSDPEISQVRHMFTALSRGVDFRWEAPENPSEDDLKAQEFAQQVMDDIEGGPGGLLETIVSQVPFFGWGWWEAVPGIRDPKWSPPDGDTWRSTYDDGLIGFRKLAFRDTSSLYRWEFDDKKRLVGMVQRDQSDFGDEHLIPLNKSLHLTFGDTNNPEGLSPLEAVWRLERIKYGLEVVQGIGFEHSAGYLNIEVGATLNETAKQQIDTAARNIMTAKEGNYGAWPEGVTAELKDVPFSAAASLLEAIRYYGVLKLSIYTMQWAAMSTVSGTGSYSAHQDSSEMFITFYNAMLEGFAKQIDEQLGRRLFEINKDAFPGMTERPHLSVTPIRKSVDLTQVSTLLRTAYDIGMRLSDDDWVAIRKQIKFLPETLPEEGAEIDQKPEEDVQPDKIDDTEDENDKKIDKVNKRDMAAKRPFVVGDDEHVDYNTFENVDERDAEKAIAKLKRANKRKNLGLDDLIGFLEAKPYKGDE